MGLSIYKPSCIGSSLRRLAAVAQQRACGAPRRSRCQPGVDQHADHQIDEHQAAEEHPAGVRRAPPTASRTASGALSRSGDASTAASFGGPSSPSSSPRRAAATPSPRCQRTRTRRSPLKAGGGAGGVVGRSAAVAPGTARRLRPPKDAALRRADQTSSSRRTVEHHVTDARHHVVAEDARFEDRSARAAQGRSSCRHRSVTSPCRAASRTPARCLKSRRRARRAGSIHWMEPARACRRRRSSESSRGAYEGRRTEDGDGDGILPRPAPCGPTPLWHLSSSAVYVLGDNDGGDDGGVSETLRTAGPSSARAPRRPRPFSEKRQERVTRSTARTEQSTAAGATAVLGRLRLVRLVLLGGVLDGGDVDGDDEVEPT